MNSAYDEMPEKEPRDWSKFIWAAVIIGFLIMIGVMWLTTTRGSADTTRVRAKHILIEYDTQDPADQQRARELAEEIRARLLAGESFNKLAREYSDDENNAARGGDLGWSPRGAYTDAFETFVWSAPLNEISEIIHTGFGYHIVVVTDREISEIERYDQEIRDRVIGDGSGPRSEPEE